MTSAYLTRPPRTEAQVTEEMLAALEDCVETLKRADASTGVCMCGEEMDRHAEPMDSNHQPMDAGTFYADRVTNFAASVIQKAKGGVA